MINSYIKVIKNLNFRRLWLGQITSQVALNMLSFVLAIRVYQETHSNTAVSLMFLSFGIPSLIFGIIAGGIVDFFDKRNILIFCNCFRIFILLGFFFFQSNLVAIYILTILIAIVTQLFIPSEAPSIPSLVHTTELLAANSLFTISFYLSTVTGFILSGPAINIVGPVNVYLLMIILMFMASYFVFRLPKIGAKHENLSSISFELIEETIGDGLKFIKSNKRVGQSLILMTFSQALIATLAVLGPGFSDKVLGIALTDASYLVMGPAAIGLILGAIWVGGYGNKFLKGTIILIGIITSAVNLLFLSLIASTHFLVNSLYLSIFLLFLLGISNSFVSVPANTILQEDSQSDMRGRVYGVLTSMTGGVSLMPVLFSGLLADTMGIEKTLFFIGIAVLIVGAYHFLQRRKANHIIRIL